MYFDGIPTKRKNIYIKRGMESDRDIRRYFPTKYHDYSYITRLKEHDFSVEEKNDIAVIARITSVEDKEKNGKKYIVVKYEECGTGTSFHSVIFGLWNGIRYLSEYIGEEILVAGKFDFDPTFGYKVSQPQMFTDIKGNLKIHPVYRKISGISDNSRDTDIQQVLSDKEIDGIPAFIREKYNIPEINDAISTLHYPKSMNCIKNAENRIILDDLIYLNTLLYVSKHDVCTDIVCPDRSMVDEVIQKLPFMLTEGQKSAVNKIVKNTQEGILSDELIQGDVGCGKTIVAFLSMIHLASNGYQSVFMAPTQVLAEQHFRKLCELVGDEKVCFLKGGIKKSEKKKLYEKIYSGEYSYIVGTQSIIANIADIPFDNLGLAIIDEDHKYGVEQRAALLGKNIHTILMSATPLPRTYAQAKYGEMIDIIRIQDKPADRKEVVTLYNPIDQMDKLVNIIKNAVIPSNPEYVKSQVYIVCPMIEESSSEIMEGVYSAEEMYSYMSEKLDGINVGIVSGKNESSDKDDILSKFREGQIDVLVSTTVVEVGVDVPNANLMIIMNAERYGLATMHQLRGRVGRGKVQGFCILVSKVIDSRINAMLSTTDGFEIAEIDAKERSFGNFIGVEQSGKNKITEEMFKYPNLNELSKRIVEEIESYKSVIESFNNYFLSE